MAFIVRIDVGQERLLAANCPHCGRTGYFDNREGSVRDRLDGKETASGRPNPRSGSGLDFRHSGRLPRSVKREPFRIGFPAPGEINFRNFIKPLMFLGGASSLIALAVWLVFAFMPLNYSGLTAGMNSLRTNRILDSEGRVIAELFDEKNGNLKPEEIPADLKRVLLYVEDRHFYEHSGIHWPSLFRAAVKNLFSFGYSQGGSTITQQLSRILLKERKKTISRKIREARFAYHLEGKFSKEQILTAYMNNVYLGHGATGFDTASRFYFRKGVGELNFIEMLILSSLPSAPERLSPVKNPSLMEAKIDAIYGRMREEGLAPFPASEYESKKSEAFRSITRSPNETVFGSRINDSPYVGEYVRLKIREILGSEYEYGAGLTIETTINGSLQRAATEQTSRHVRSAAGFVKPVVYDENNEVKWDLDLGEKILREYSNMSIGPVLFGLPQPPVLRTRLESASIGVDPKSGEILFMQGGSEFTAGNQFNRAISMRRQTGSAIKPIVYSAAIEKGVITAASRIDDTPIFHKNDEGYWLPGNITGVYEGNISVRHALKYSKNVPAIRVAQLTGMERLSEQFRKFFFLNDDDFRRRFRADYTIAIGSLEMSPLEMAVAFGAFGNNGFIVRPVLIKRILDSDGRELYSSFGADEFKTGIPSRHQAIPGDVAEVMASLLRDSASNGGTGLGTDQLLGKTGTTNNHKDAWFIGVVPGLSMAVWVGFDDPRYSMPGTTGASVAGPLFGSIVSTGYRRKSEIGFTPHAKRISVCAESGNLPTPACPKTVSEYFTIDHPPEGTCQIHAGKGSTENWSINSDSDFR